MHESSVFISKSYFVPLLFILLPLHYNVMSERKESMNEAEKEEMNERRSETRAGELSHRAWLLCLLSSSSFSH